MPEKAKMEKFDRISDLHDSILSHILSFLPTKEAVGTSILSTRWRYLFTLVSNLDFQLDYNESTEGIRSFTCFVDRMLFFHNRSNVDKFRLIDKNGNVSSCICGWICAAVSRGVKHLDLNIDLHKFDWPGVLFTCRTLTTLKLVDKSLQVLNVPNNVCLPNLKTLHLQWIEFPDDDSVKCLLSGCMSLEDLVIEKCHVKKINISHNLLRRLTILNFPYENSSSVLIDAPGLVYFKYNGGLVGEHSLKNMESLVEADIDIGSNDHQVDPTSLFRGLCNVRSLILSSSSLKLFDSCEPLPVFPKLVHLKICHDNNSGRALA